MPLKKFLKKIGSSLFQSSSAKPTASTTSRHRGGTSKDASSGSRKRSRPEGGRKPAASSGKPSRKRNRAQPAPGGRREGDAKRGSRPAETRPAAETGDASPDRPAKSRSGSRRNGGERRRGEGRRGDDRRGGRRSAGTRASRRPQRELPPTADELKAKDGKAPVVDSAWSIDQFVVAPQEGKKRFHDFDLPVEIMRAIADLGFRYCTPIQAESLALALEGRNVAGRAQTGTGKTAAFLVAILARFLRSPESRPDKNGTPRALIIAPTRELVIQICRDAEALGRYCNLRSFAVYGGMDYNAQLRQLQEGPIDLLVATPGRLIDFQRQHAVDLSRVDTLVIDEADRMLDMGFIPDVRKIIRCLPPRDQRRTMLYSATLSDEVMKLASQWMPDPVKVEIEAESAAAETVRQYVFITTTQEKYVLLCNLLQRYEGQRVLVFCNRRVTTDRLAERLERQGFACEVLSGDVDQRRRLRVIEAFRSGTVKIVVATDVAGRGLHIADIGLVVNYELPYEAEDYVHRIGRTGRAGHVGTAVSFADPDESFVIPAIEEYIGEELKCEMPEAALLAPLPPPRRRKSSPRRSKASAASGASAGQDESPEPEAGPEAPPAASRETEAADAESEEPASAPTPAPQAAGSEASDKPSRRSGARRGGRGSRPSSPKSDAEKAAPPPGIQGARAKAQEWTPGQP
ncbi:MAG: DEAD/DEAH box helicase [Kiritimatiellia bacterium]